MSLKYIFVSYQGIIDEHGGGMVKILLPIVNCVYKQNISLIYYLGSVSGDNSNYPFIKPVSKLFKLVVKLLSTLSKYLFPKATFRLRNVYEIVYDFLFFFKIKEPFIIISSIYLEKSTAKNRRLGGVNIFIAGNPDDVEIYNILVKEEEKYNIKIDDAYTDIVRVKKVKNSLDSFDHIISLTEGQKKSFIYNHNINKLSFQNYYIQQNIKKHPKLESIKDGVITFCYVAHPFWLKGLYYLLDAWSNINVRNVILKVAGNIDNNTKIFIRDKYQNLENVTFLGWVEDLNVFFRSSDICIVPSLLDAGPATVLEAMTYGLPVIVSDGCGHSELIEDYKNGIVVKAGDSKEIEEGISWFVNNIGLYTEMKKNAFRTAQRINSDNSQNENLSEHILSISNKLMNENSINRGV